MNCVAAAHINLDLHVVYYRDRSVCTPTQTHIILLIPSYSYMNKESRRASTASAPLLRRHKLKRRRRRITRPRDACAARLLVSCPLVFRLDLILPAISQPILQRLQRVRCALRALMMPISLSILLPFHLGRVIEIHGDIFVSNAYKR